MMTQTRGRVGIVALLLGLIALAFVTGMLRKMQLPPIDAMVVSADGITARLRLTVGDQELQTALHGADADGLSIGDTVPMRCDVSAGRAECFSGSLYGQAAAVGVLALLFLGFGLFSLIPVVRARGRAAPAAVGEGEGAS